MKNNNTMILLVINNIHITFPAYICSCFSVFLVPQNPGKFPQILWNFSQNYLNSQKP